MILLGDEAQVDARFALFGDSANLDARLVHGLRRMYHRFGNRFGHARWYSVVTSLKWMLVLVCLEIVLILTQDRCMVCAERNIGSEIVLDAPEDLLCDIGHVESHFNPFGDSRCVSAK
jgi:hypothetical protein